jgi:hypothetical protein
VDPELVGERLLAESLGFPIGAQAPELLLDSLHTYE